MFLLYFRDIFLGCVIPEKIDNGFWLKIPDEIIRVGDHHRLLKYVNSFIELGCNLGYVPKGKHDFARCTSEGGLDRELACVPG